MNTALITTNGLFRPFALVDGRAVATWTLSAGRLTIQPLEKIQAADAKALLDDAEAVQRFLGNDSPARSVPDLTVRRHVHAKSTTRTESESSEPS